MTELTPMNPQSQARMADVGAKPITPRRALAEGRVRISRALLDRIRAGTLAKGSLLDVARVAGIQAAKRTAELIPLCHPLPLDWISVEVTLGPDAVLVRAEVKGTGRTGFEMEALTAVAVAALTVVDMGKAVDPAMVIDGIRLLAKSGGVHGDYRADQ